MSGIPGKKQFRTLEDAQKDLYFAIKIFAIGSVCLFAAPYVVHYTPQIVGKILEKGKSSPIEGS